MIGLIIAMAFVWAVQAQAAERAWQRDVTLIFEKESAGHV